LNRLLPLFGQGAGVPYGCGIEGEAARRRDSAEATPYAAVSFRTQGTAGHISVGLANWFDGLVCIAVTERKSAF